MNHFEIFPWNHNFETGIPLIDEQHRELVRLLNSLVDHIARDAEVPVLDEVLRQISDYVVYHFSTEEEIWRLHFDGDSWLKWHHQSHGDFVKEIAKIREAKSAQSFEETLLDIVKFLTHWLARHILDSDKRMAKVVLALPSGISLAMAKEAADAEMTGAAKVLVDTLMTMYDRLADSTVGMSREIQRRQKAEVDLNRAKSDLEKSSQAKSVFLANLSHELRTPLNTILGYSELLYRDAAVSGPVKDTLDVIRKSGDHLLTVINEVLEIAKIEAGHVALEMTPVDLSTLIDEVMGMFQLRASQKGIFLRLDGPAHPGKRFITDEAKVKRILINLVSNAIKATNEGGVLVRMTFIDGEAQRALVEVEDSGVGIAPEDWEKIFVPFVQVDGLQSSQGSGLGLAISKEYAGLLGGTIVLSSEVGHGSVFRFEFPITPSLSDETAHAAKAQGDVVGLAPDQVPLRVLVVDDDDHHRMLLSQLLERVGFAVEVGANGAQAIEKFQTWAPHFIWMDCRMPVMSGVEAARRIRALAGGKAVKIAGVTASINLDNPQEADTSDFDTMVYKPFRARQIYECMEALVGVRLIRASVGESPPPSEAAVEIRVEDVQRLPAEHRTRLTAALHRLSQDEILAAIEPIRALDESLASALLARARRYDYEPILRCLGAAPAADERVHTAVDRTDPPKP